MQNPSLYEAIRNYSQSALAFLQGRLAGPEDLPTIPMEKVEYVEDGGFKQSYVIEVLWYMFVGRNDESLRQTDSYRKAVRALQDDPAATRHLNTLVGTRELSIRLDADQCLRSLLTRLLEKQSGLDFDRAIFDNVYKEFEEYFYRDVSEYRFFSPLNGFRGEFEKLKLGHGFSIVRISKGEKERILSDSKQYGSFNPLHVQWPFTDYALELLLDIPKVFGETRTVPYSDDMPSQVARRQFEEACSALRLYKSGAVSHDYVRVGTTSWELHGGTFTTSSIGARPAVGPNYALSKEEVPDFLDFWGSFQEARVKTRRRIDVALRRFNFAYERVRPEDKLIDYLIGFEALLLGAGHGELEYKLALRGSALLGKLTHDRERIFDDLMAAYRERSNVVHGGPLKATVKVAGSLIPFAEFVDGTEQHLRSAITEFLWRAEIQSEKQVVDDLDKKIMSGS